MKRPFFLLHLLFLLLAFSSFSLFLHLFSKTKPHAKSPNLKFFPHSPLKVYIADIPREFNYGLLEHFYSLRGPDSRLGWNPDASRFSSFLHRLIKTHFSTPPYPQNPLIKPHGAEYYMLNDLQKVKDPKGAAVIRVYTSDEADVILVPFFASLSAEIELGWGQKGKFMKRDEEKNSDYRRQREVVDRIKMSEAWRRSGGRDHVFVMPDPVAMWHVRREIAPAILLVEDFGGWYKTDSNICRNEDICHNSNIIQHTEVSLLKDVIVPYHHLIPTLRLLDNRPRHTLLYFKGAKHRHRGGSVREKLWNMLANKTGVIMEEGSLNSTSIQDSVKGMRDSEFCLHPAGDTPTSCRLFDAIASLCIPIIVSDQIELPFEGTIDYTEIAIFISVKNALTPNWLVNHIKSFSEEHKETFRTNMARYQSFFEYDGGGAVNQIWEMIDRKLPIIRQAIIMQKRKTDDMQPRDLTCHCT